MRLKAGELIAAPVPMSSVHITETFNSGVEVLDVWLRQRALKNEKEGASRAFVSTTDADTVIAYYSLAAGSVSHRLSTGSVRRNMPDPVPALILGRLAVDLNWQSKGLGYSLLKDALLRCVAAGSHIGARVVLVHAISTDAKRFYQYFGFKESPMEDMTLMLPIKEIVANG